MLGTTDSHAHVDVLKERVEQVAALKLGNCGRAGVGQACVWGECWPSEGMQCMQAAVLLSGQLSISAETWYSDTQPHLLPSWLTEVTLV